MGNLKKWLGGNADVMLDETTGAVLVKEDATTPGVKPQIDIVTVAATATLDTLIGAVLNASTKRVTLRPHADGIYMNDTTADANSCPLGTNVWTFDGGPSELDELQFFAATVKMSVIQEG